MAETPEEHNGTRDRPRVPLSPEERSARANAGRKAWNDAHPDYYRDYRERNRESIRKKNRERERERYRKKKAEAERRRRDIERAREWAQRNPERRRETRRRWVENNRDRVRASQLAYYHRNKDTIAQRARERRLADPQKRRDQQRRWQQANPEKVAENQRRYRSNPETAAKVREYNREWKRRERRRQQAALPPRRLHSVSEPERIANLTAATEFFARRRRAAERRRLLEHFEKTPRPLLELWMRESALARRRQVVPDYLVEHGERLRDEVALDSRARPARGAAPFDIEVEVRRRAIIAVRRAQEGSRTAPSINAKARTGTAMQREQFEIAPRPSSRDNLIARTR